MANKTRRPIVKTFERKSRLKQEDNWTQLGEAVTAIQNSLPVKTPYEVLYDFVINFCQTSQAKQVYCNLHNLIDTHTAKSLQKFHDSDLESIHFLKEINKSWQSHYTQLIKIRFLFVFLDKSYVRSNLPAPSIWDLGLERFRHYFSTEGSILKRTVDEVLKLICQERDSLLVDRALIKDILSMLSSLSIYSSAFEPKFIKDTKQLYCAKSTRQINELDVSEYLVYVERIIAEELDRATYYLNMSTRPLLMAAIDYELIARHLDTILSKGLDSLLESSNIENLILLNKLASRVLNGPETLCEHFKQFVKKRGKLLVANPEKDKTMVVDLLTFKEQMDKVVNDCFMKQERFLNALKIAFEDFINQRPNKPAELIAKYIDAKLKSGNREASEEELEKILDKILVIFRYIHGKDVFEAFYNKDLAKRLLMSKSASVDAEKSMLAKLKQECGADFTGKLEGMFKDIELSKDIMQSFKGHLSNTDIKTSIDLYVNVLTTGFWPTYEPIKVIFPEFMLQHHRHFETFYLQKHSGRKLQWQPNLDHCTLVAEYKDNSDKTTRHELQVTLFQTLVLLLFNTNDELKFKQISDATEIESVELKRTLQSLACGKVRVLTKEPKGRDVNETDKFLYNKSFSYHLFKIKISQVQLKETQEEQCMTQEKIFLDRQYQIDAAIVRIMKTRKQLPYNTLLNEVFAHLRFPARSNDVKARIESLIERDYLNRDVDNFDVYNYVT